MNFCPECNNLMKPKAINRELFYQCNVCQTKPQVKAETAVVYKKVISGGKSTEVTRVNKDLILDPALPRKNGLLCPRCDTEGPVYYQPSEESMLLSYICTNHGCVYTGSLEDFKKVSAN